METARSTTSQHAGMTVEEDESSKKPRWRTGHLDHRGETESRFLTRAPLSTLAAVGRGERYERAHRSSVIERQVRTEKKRNRVEAAIQATSYSITEAQEVPSNRNATAWL